jgi:hypothetical protein
MDIEIRAGKIVVIWGDCLHKREKRRIAGRVSDWE